VREGFEAVVAVICAVTRVANSAEGRAGDHCVDQDTVDGYAAGESGGDDLARLEGCDRRRVDIPRSISF
jgi:hypothetical protein